MEMPSVSYEVTKVVGKLVQGLQGILELWSCWRQCMYIVGPLGRWWLSLKWWMTKTTGRWTPWKRWSPRSGQRLIVLTLDFSILDSKSGLCNQTCILFNAKIFFAMCDDWSYEPGGTGRLSGSCALQGGPCPFPIRWATVLLALENVIIRFVRDFW